MYYTFIFIYIVCYLAYPTVREESFRVMPIGILFSPYGVIICMCSVSYIKAVDTIGTSFFYCSWFYTFDLGLFGSHFCSLLFPWDSITIVLNGVDFLSVVVKLNDFATLGLAAGVGFCRFMRPLRGVLFRVYFYYFKILWGVSGTMQKACIFAPVVASLRWTVFFFLRLPE